MLGEDHSLTKDFPDYTQTIAKNNSANFEIGAVQRIAELSEIEAVQKMLSFGLLVLAILQ